MTAVWLAAALLCMLYVSEAAYSVPSTRCCTQLGDNISKSLLKQVKGYDIQRQDGTCHLQAVRLHLKHKTLCISSTNKRVKQWVKRQEEKRSGKKESGKNRPGRKKRRNKPKNKKKRIKKEKRHPM